MGFLNLDGLKQYTANLLNLLQGFVPTTRKINGKPLTSDITTHTAGLGVAIDDDVINLDNPMRGIYTQEEFDALSEEERKTGTYIIPGLNDDGTFTPITDDQIDALFGTLIA